MPRKIRMTLALLALTLPALAMAKDGNTTQKCVKIFTITICAGN